MIQSAELQKNQSMFWNVQNIQDKCFFGNVYLVNLSSITALSYILQSFRKGFVQYVCFIWILKCSRLSWKLSLLCTNHFKT